MFGFTVTKFASNVAPDNKAFEIITPASCPEKDEFTVNVVAMLLVFFNVFERISLG